MELFTKFVNKALGEIHVKEECNYDQWSNWTFCCWLWILSKKYWWGWQKIANYLTDKKIPSPRKLIGAKNAGSVWHETAVKLILLNRHYTGDLVQGRSSVDRSNKLFHQEKGYKPRQQVDESKWFVVENAHPPIISHEEFAAVQDRMAVKARTGFGGRGKSRCLPTLHTALIAAKGWIIRMTAKAMFALLIRSAAEKDALPISFGMMS